MNEVHHIFSLKNFGGEKNVDKVAVVILNQPITTPYFDILWKKALVKICADGGVNRLFTYLKSSSQGLLLADKEYVPDFIVGDLDSIDLESKTFYSDKGTKLLYKESQDSCDHDKALMLIEELEYFPEDLNSVWMICNTSGRLDHLFSQIHSLYHFKKWPIYLLSQSWITFLLPQGDSLIEVNRVSIGNSIGLIPIGQPCAVWTRGLKWNLGQTLSFSGLISSSNTFETDDVTEIYVRSDHPLLCIISTIGND